MAKVKPYEECGKTKEYHTDNYRRSDYPDESGPPGQLRYPLVRICGRCWEGAGAVQVQEAGRWRKTTT